MKDVPLQPGPELPILVVTARVSPRSRRALAAGLPTRLGGDTVLVFVSFAPASVPLGATFDFVFPRADPAAAVAVRCRLDAVTQEFARPFHEVPSGWRTVCALTFDGGPPPILTELPAVDSWSEATGAPLGLCSAQTWRSLREEGAKPSSL